MFGGKIGFWELVIILAIVLLIFGGSRLKDLARSMGEGIKEFKKGVKEEDEKSQEKKS